MVTLYVDADDTILDSSKAVIEILNEKYNLSPAKTILDLEDWNYHSICDEVTAAEVTEIYNSKDFFDRVKIKKGFENFLRKHKNKFSLKIVTKGTSENLRRKEEYFAKYIPEAEVIGVGFSTDTLSDFGKGHIDMTGGIQIDDRTDSLNTNAPIKILITHGMQLPWNQYLGEYDKESVYILENWDLIEESLLFFYEHPEFIN